MLVIGKFSPVEIGSQIKITDGYGNGPFPAIVLKEATIDDYYKHIKTIPHSKSLLNQMKEVVKTQKAYFYWVSTD